jgi:stage III sporulation protein AB
MLKYGGIALILTAGGLLGWLKGREYSDYTALLHGLATALEVLETEVRYKQNPLVQAFAATGRGVAEQRAAGLFLRAAAYLREQPQTLPDEGWEQGIAAIHRYIPRGEPLVQQLQSFGRALGRTDLATQETLFALLRRQVGQCLERAAARQEKEGRLWQYLGVSGSIILIIMLL